EGAHLLAAVRRQPTRAAERDEVGIDVGDAVSRERAEERLHLLRRLLLLQPAVLQPGRVAVVVEGMRRAVRGRLRVGEEGDRADEEEDEEQQDAQDEDVRPHGASATRSTTAAA